MKPFLMKLVGKPKHSTSPHEPDHPRTQPQPTTHHRFDTIRMKTEPSISAIAEGDKLTTSPTAEVVEGSAGDVSLEATAFEKSHDEAPELLKTPTSRPLIAEKRTQSLVSPGFYKLLQTEVPTANPTVSTGDYFGLPTLAESMVNNRRIWVKRGGASATLVSIHEDDLVDDVRDMILRKYANSLGRNFDSPDVTLRVVPREQQERTLGPEESIAKTLDTYFPGGQTVEEALVIDVPLRRSTPRASPRPYDERRPHEAGSDYFPPMPATVVSTHAHSPGPSAALNGSVHHPPPHAMSIVTTGQVPALPSPGGATRRHRPRMGRTHTTSPQTNTVQTPGSANGTSALAYALHAGSRPRTRSNASEHSNHQVPIAPPLPTPPPTQADLSIQRVATPPPRVSSPRPPTNRQKKPRKTATDHPSFPAGMLNGAVPPINVLIVEDNIINLKLLEAFMKRLKVRWQTAMNGREAVTKWRTGGFHLVLMDIQLPVMSGLEATKAIRRLERLNSIGVFSSSASSSAPEREEGEEPEEDDRLNVEGKFKSPVIIVALTASSLQSDRHEALAAGCNDFLTKVCFLHPPASIISLPVAFTNLFPHALYTSGHANNPPSPSTSSGSNAK